MPSISDAGTAPRITPILNGHQPKRDVKVVQQKLPRPGPQPVFNLEVHGEHVYFVGEDGVLVHNACDSTHVYALLKHDEVVYIGSGSLARAAGNDNPLIRMAAAKFGGDVELAKAAGYDFRFTKLSDEFQARGMEQKLMDYFGGPDGSRRGLSWADDSNGLLNVNQSWRWSRTDDRGKAFKSAYLNEQLFARTLNSLFGR